MIEVADEGLIKLFKLNADWHQTEDDSDRFEKFADAPHLIRFGVKTNPEVTISFYFRGRAVDSETARDFAELLKAKPHQLSVEEITAVELVLRDAAEPKFFKINSIRTEALQQSMVLACEGKWLSTGLLNLGIFLNIDTAGKFIQEIHYLAPESDYEKYLQQFLSALSTIELNELAVS